MQMFVCVYIYCLAVGHLGIVNDTVMESTVVAPYRTMRCCDHRTNNTLIQFQLVRVDTLLLARQIRAKLLYAHGAHCKVTVQLGALPLPRLI